MTLRNKIKTGIIALVALTSLSTQPENPINIPVCVEHSQQLTQQEKQLTIESFNLAQQKALEQNIILEPTNREEAGTNNAGYANCQTLQYLDFGAYIEADTTIQRNPEREGFYEYEKSQLTPYANTSVSKRISLGFAQRDTGKVSVTQTMLSATTKLPYSEEGTRIAQEFKKAYLAYVTLHEIGHTAGLLHPDYIPNTTEEQRDLLDIYKDGIPGVMGDARPLASIRPTFLNEPSSNEAYRVQESPYDVSAHDNGAYTINTMQKNILRQGVNSESELYHIIRESSTLAEVRDWYEANIDSTQATQYLGFTEENYENLPGSLQEALQQ